MDRLTLALTVVFVAIGPVMAIVWALAHFGQRAMLRPPGTRTMHRLGIAMAVFGGLTLLMVIPLAARGAVIRLLFTLVQGAVSLPAGLSIARQYRPTAGQ
jgi:hypothetical protein